VETSLLQHLLSQLGLKDIDELAALAQERTSISERIKQTHHELEKARRELRIDERKQEISRLQQNADECRKRMAKLSGVALDPYALRREIAELEGLTSAAHGMAGGQSSQATQLPREALSSSWIKKAAAVLSVNAAALIGQVRAGLDTNLTTLSGRTLCEAIVHGDRIVGFTTGKGGKNLVWDDLTPHA
jgi:hypothetical protein